MHIALNISKDCSTQFRQWKENKCSSYFKWQMKFGEPKRSLYAQIIWCLCCNVTCLPELSFMSLIEPWGYTSFQPALTFCCAQRGDLLGVEDGNLFGTYQYYALISWSAVCMITRVIPLTPGFASLRSERQTGNLTYICGMVMLSISFGQVG